MASKKRNSLKFTITIVILDLLTLIFLFLFYGPISYFRNLLITTAMTTQNHKYLAQILYSTKTIEKILKQNNIVDMNQNTNTSDIQMENNNQTDYDSVYEEQIRKRNPNNDLYKIIPLEGKNYKGYLVAIYDASRISLVSSKDYGIKGQTLKDMASSHHAKVATNASGFLDTDFYGNGGIASGVFIQNGKLISGNANTKARIIGFNQKHVLTLMNATAIDALNAGIQDAVEFGPFLIVNGKPATIKGNGGWGIAPRTAIAQRKDGIVLFIVIDGRQPGYSLGIDMKELTNILLRYKAYNASNLDGGASSSLNIEGNLYSKPCAHSNTKERFLPNAWIVK